MPLNLKGNDLPELIRLSNYLPSTPTAVRFTGLRKGQTVEVDVSLDGGYTQPDEPKKAPWNSPDGQREGVHSALLSITKSEGFDLVFTGKSELCNSRGRGLAISNSLGFAVDDAWIKSARTAGIAIQDCRGFKLSRVVTVDTCNYLAVKTDMNVHNVAGSITMKGCHDYDVLDAISVDHIGNGITATESDNGRWQRPTTIGVYGANLYVNASPQHSIDGGIALGSKTHRPAAYVLNREEENEKSPPSEGAKLIACLGFDVEWGLSVWGNEGATLEIAEVSLLNGIFVADNLEPKRHKRTTIKRFDQAGTRFIDPAKVDKIPLAAIRNMRDTLAELVRFHADWEAIQQEREAIRFAIGTLGGKPAPVDPPADPVKPIDRIALLALLDEAKGWPTLISDWQTKLRSLVE